MLLAISYITYGYCIQSHLSSEDYDQAMQGLRTTRWVRTHLTGYSKIPVAFFKRVHPPPPPPPKIGRPDHIDWLVALPRLRYQCQKNLFCRYRDVHMDKHTRGMAVVICFNHWPVLHQRAPVIHGPHPRELCQPPSSTRSSNKNKYGENDHPQCR